jgi:uncharacterized repeat protein (TIGR01451 family)
MRSPTARALATLLAVGLLALGTATVAAAQGSDADLSVATQFTGHGKPKAKLGQLVTLAVTVTNHGPATAQAVELHGTAGDPFNLVSVSCAGNTESGGSAPCGDLDSGGTAHGTVVLQFVAFPVGEPRHTSGGAGATTSTTDPNLDDNFASLEIKLIGPHGFFIPGP